ncbi:MAG TPA: prolipoprotein diacylglyceryl transferase [Dongiaceae bacterium]|nr:prolipoprotein diacylglyceryl transferase [Dongiaceae bacterium]
MHPIAFYIGSFAVHWYGIMTALGFLAGLWTASRRGMLAGFLPEKILDIGPWLILGTILGARTMYVTTYWDEEFAGKPISEIFMVQHGGLVFYGGLIGAALACILYAWFKKMPLWKLADVLAPSIALGSAFGRVGCLLNGCCYGRACSLPWAITFPADNPLNPPTTPVHPTEIYDSALNLILYLTLAWLFRRRKFDGQIFALFLMCYAITRSTVESFRGDYTVVHYHFGLTPAQVVGIGTFATGLVLWWWCSRRPQVKPAAAAQPVPKHP